MRIWVLANIIKGAIEITLGTLGIISSIKLIEDDHPILAVISIGTSIMCFVSATITFKGISNPKYIEISRISNNPKDDIYTSGYNDSSVSYHKRFYSENGKFTNKEPLVVYDLGDGDYMLQNGHHRLKAAQQLGIEKVKVDVIISYEESKELGITQLEKFKPIPKQYR